MSLATPATAGWECRSHDTPLPRPAGPGDERAPGAAFGCGGAGSLFCGRPPDGGHEVRRSSAGIGPGLRERLESAKRADGTALFTRIHHRQSPAWLAEGSIDAAIVWSTEAIHHLGLGAPFEEVRIDPAHNRAGAYAAAVVTGAPHPGEATAFVDYLTGPDGRACYQRYGFGQP
jgi:hypothetical protein